MKTKEELESLKNEMAQLKKKLVELTDDELAIVTGGSHKELNFHNRTEIAGFSYNSGQVFVNRPVIVE